MLRTVEELREIVEKRCDPADAVQQINAGMFLDSLLLPCEGSFERVCDHLDVETYFIFEEWLVILSLHSLQYLQRTVSYSEDCEVMQSSADVTRLTIANENEELAQLVRNIANRLYRYLGNSMIMIAPSIDAVLVRPMSDHYQVFSPDRVSLTSASPEQTKAVRVDDWPQNLGDVLRLKAAGFPASEALVPVDARIR
jgi:hypothetical protein